MGARINFVFDDGSDSLVVLYSHWGAESWVSELSSAIEFAKPREGDSFYWCRIVVSQLTKDATDSTTGYGLYAIQRDQIAGLWDETVVIDLEKNTVRGIAFDKFQELARVARDAGVDVHV